jgi:hypothetical protein
MDIKEREQKISEYFKMWIGRDFSGLEEIFSKDIYYSECYGPEYYGMSEINKWIEDMLKKQVVYEWRINQYYHSENTTVVEWYFREETDNTPSDFNGVSIITFNEDGLINSIKEFESKAEHTALYHRCL